jgi:hypothetical protein
MMRKALTLTLTIGLAVVALIVSVNLIAVADSVGTGFTYQGYLEDSNGAVNGDYGFKFKLCSTSDCTTQVGSTQEMTRTVSDGVFTAELDFGSGAFDGEARWLEISVRESGQAYTTITPRTELTPAPYALHAMDAWSINGNSGTTAGTNFLGTTDDTALQFHVNGARALRLEPHSTSPNVIGGYSGNSVTSGAWGATIGGGGKTDSANSVTWLYGTVGGGLGNTAHRQATVGGGEGNTASGESATVGGGSGNEASGGWASVGGGTINIVAGSAATVGGGQGNDASGSRATVSGGWSNEASGLVATVGGGFGNTAGGEYATVGGGEGNEASADYTTVPGGHSAKASHYGEMAYASGNFTNKGDAQASLYVLRHYTDDENPKELYLDYHSESERVTVAGDRTLTFDIMVVARSDDGDSAGYRAEGVIENYGGTTSFVGTPIVDELGEDADWTVTVEADDTNDALVIKVTGASSTYIHWVATVRTAEVAQ